jgi:hypothetical protein
VAVQCYAGRTIGPSKTMKNRLAAAAGLVGLATGLAVVPVVLDPASAVPSYARQTGQPCATCHMDFPELTPYGRRFKLLGYTAGGSQCGNSGPRPSLTADQKRSLKDYLANTSSDGIVQDLTLSAGLIPEALPPISFMVLPSFTHTAKSVPANPSASPSFKVNDNTVLQTFSIFYAGQIYCDFGAFVQVTHDVDSPYAFFFSDNTDFRYARQLNFGGHDVVFGATVNNNPTVQDLWNTTPAWGFPYASAPGAAPGPSFGTQIEGAFGGLVAGAGIYAYIDDLLYIELSAYVPQSKGMLAGLGNDPAGAVKFDGAASYWRAALEKNWGEHSLMFGTFGLHVNPYPNADPTQPADHFTDIGFDTQYQFIGDSHAFSFKGSYIKEYQTLDGTFAGAGSDNFENTLSSFKLTGTYVYDKTISASLQWFKLAGSADATLYGTPGGTPDSAGWVGDVSYMPFNRGGPALWPWVNARIGISYTAYSELDGLTNAGGLANQGLSSCAGKLGLGGKASDCNTTYIYFWTAF